METSHRRNSGSASTHCKKYNAYNAKLAPKHLGPLEVRKIISPVIVDLRDARGKWHRHIHVQDLKPAATNGTKIFTRK